MAELSGIVGFAPAIARTSATQRRRAGVELIAMAALFFSLIVAATAVSIGVARAHAFGSIGCHGAADVVAAPCQLPPVIRL